MPAASPKDASDESASHSPLPSAITGASRSHTPPLPATAERHSSPQGTSAAQHSGSADSLPSLSSHARGVRRSPTRDAAQGARAVAPQPGRTPSAAASPAVRPVYMSRSQRSSGHAPALVEVFPAAHGGAGVSGSGAAESRAGLPPVAPTTSRSTSGASQRSGRSQTDVAAQQRSPPPAPDPAVATAATPTPSKTPTSGTGVTGHGRHGSVVASSETTSSSVASEASGQSSGSSEGGKMAESGPSTALDSSTGVGIPHPPKLATPKAPAQAQQGSPAGHSSRSNNNSSNSGGGGAVSAGAAAATPPGEQAKRECSTPTRPLPTDARGTGAAPAQGVRSPPVRRPLPLKGGVGAAPTTVARAPVVASAKERIKAASLATQPPNRTGSTPAAGAAGSAGGAGVDTTAHGSLTSATAIYASSSSLSLASASVPGAHPVHHGPPSSRRRLRIESPRRLSTSSLSSASMPSLAASALGSTSGVAAMPRATQRPPAPHNLPCPRPHRTATPPLAAPAAAAAAAHEQPPSLSAADVSGVDFGAFASTNVFEPMLPATLHSPQGSQASLSTADRSSSASDATTPIKSSVLPLPRVLENSGNMTNTTTTNTTTDNSSCTAPSMLTTAPETLLGCSATVEGGGAFVLSKLAVARRGPARATAQMGGGAAGKGGAVSLPVNASPPQLLTAENAPRTNAAAVARGRSLPPLDAALPDGDFSATQHRPRCFPLLSRTVPGLANSSIHTPDAHDTRAAVAGGNNSASSFFTTSTMAPSKPSLATLGGGSATSAALLKRGPSMRERPQQASLNGFDIVGVGEADDATPLLRHRADTQQPLGRPPSTPSSTSRAAAAAPPPPTAGTERQAQGGERRRELVSLLAGGSPRAAAAAARPATTTSAGRRSSSMCSKLSGSGAAAGRDSAATSPTQQGYTAGLAATARRGAKSQPSTPFVVTPLEPQLLVPHAFQLETAPAAGASSAAPAGSDEGAANPLQPAPSPDKASVGEGLPDDAASPDREALAPMQRVALDANAKRYSSSVADVGFSIPSLLSRNTDVEPPSNVTIASPPTTALAPSSLSPQQLARVPPPRTAATGSDVPSGAPSRTGDSSPKSTTEAATPVYVARRDLQSVLQRSDNSAATFALVNSMDTMEDSSIYCEGSMHTHRFVSASRLLPLRTPNSLAIPAGPAHGGSVDSMALAAPSRAVVAAASAVVSAAPGSQVRRMDSDPLTTRVSIDDSVMATTPKAATAASHPRPPHNPSVRTATTAATKAVPAESEGPSVGAVAAEATGGRPLDEAGSAAVLSSFSPLFKSSASPALVPYPSIATFASDTSQSFDSQTRSRDSRLSRHAAGQPSAQEDEEDDMEASGKDAPDQPQTRLRPDRSRRPPQQQKKHLPRLHAESSQDTWTTSDSSEHNKASVSSGKNGSRVTPFAVPHSPQLAGDVKPLQLSLTAAHAEATTLSSDDNTAAVPEKKGEEDRADATSFIHLESSMPSRTLEEVSSPTTNTSSLPPPQYTGAPRRRSTTLMLISQTASRLAARVRRTAHHGTTPRHLQPQQHSDQQQVLRPSVDVSASQSTSFSSSADTRNTQQPSYASNSISGGYSLSGGVSMTMPGLAYAGDGAAEHNPHAGGDHLTAVSSLHRRHSQHSGAVSAAESEYATEIATSVPAASEGASDTATEEGAVSGPVEPLSSTDRRRRKQSLMETVKKLWMKAAEPSAPASRTSSVSPRRDSAAGASTRYPSSLSQHTPRTRSRAGDAATAGTASSPKAGSATASQVVSSASSTTTVCTSARASRDGSPLSPRPTRGSHLRRGSSSHPTSGTADTSADLDSPSAVPETATPRLQQSLPAEVLVPAQRDLRKLVADDVEVVAPQPAFLASGVGADMLKSPKKPGKALMPSMRIPSPNLSGNANSSEVYVARQPRPPQPQQVLRSVQTVNVVAPSMDSSSGLLGSAAGPVTQTLAFNAGEEDGEVVNRASPPGSSRSGDSPVPSAPESPLSSTSSSRMPSLTSTAASELSLGGQPTRPAQGQLSATTTTATTAQKAATRKRNQLPTRQSALASFTSHGSSQSTFSTFSKLKAAANYAKARVALKSSGSSGAAAAAPPPESAASTAQANPAQPLAPHLPAGQSAAASRQLPVVRHNLHDALHTASAQPPTQLLAGQGREAYKQTISANAQELWPAASHSGAAASLPMADATNPFVAAAVLRSRPTSGRPGSARLRPSRPGSAPRQPSWPDSHRAGQASPRSEQRAAASTFRSVVREADEAADAADGAAVRVPANATLLQRPRSSRRPPVKIALGAETLGLWMKAAQMRFPATHHAAEAGGAAAVSAGESSAAPLTALRVPFSSTSSPAQPPGTVPTAAAGMPMSTVTAAAADRAATFAAGFSKGGAQGGLPQPSRKRVFTSALSAPMDPVLLSAPRDGPHPPLAATTPSAPSPLTPADEAPSQRWPGGRAASISGFAPFSATTFVPFSGSATAAHGRGSLTLTSRRRWTSLISTSHASSPSASEGSGGNDAASNRGSFGALLRAPSGSSFFPSAVTGSTPTSPRSGRWGFIGRRLTTNNNGSTNNSNGSTSNFSSVLGNGTSTVAAAAGGGGGATSSSHKVRASQRRKRPVVQRIHSLHSGATFNNGGSAPARVGSAESRRSGQVKLVDACPLAPTQQHSPHGGVLPTALPSALHRRVSLVMPGEEAVADGGAAVAQRRSSLSSSAAAVVAPRRSSLPHGRRPSKVRPPDGPLRGQRTVDGPCPPSSSGSQHSEGGDDNWLATVTQTDGDGSAAGSQWGSSGKAQALTPSSTSLAELPAFMGGEAQPSPSPRAQQQEKEKEEAAMGPPTKGGAAAPVAALGVVTPPSRGALAAASAQLSSHGRHPLGESPHEPSLPSEQAARHQGRGGGGGSRASPQLSPKLPPPQHPVGSLVSPVSQSILINSISFGSHAGGGTSGIHSLSIATNSEARDPAGTGSMAWAAGAARTESKLSSEDALVPSSSLNYPSAYPHTPYSPPPTLLSCEAAPALFTMAHGFAALPAHDAPSDGPSGFAVPPLSLDGAAVPPAATAFLSAARPSSSVDGDKAGGSGTGDGRRAGAGGFHAGGLRMAAQQSSRPQAAAATRSYGSAYKPNAVGASPTSAGSTTPAAAATAAAAVGSAQRRGSRGAGRTASYRGSNAAIPSPPAAVTGSSSGTYGANSASRSRRGGSLLAAHGGSSNALAFADSASQAQPRSSTFSLYSRHNSGVSETGSELMPYNGSFHHTSSGGSAFATSRSSNGGGSPLASSLLYVPPELRRGPEWRHLKQYIAHNVAQNQEQQQQQQEQRQQPRQRSPFLNFQRGAGGAEPASLARRSRSSEPQAGTGRRGSQAGYPVSTRAPLPAAATGVSASGIESRRQNGTSKGEKRPAGEVARYAGETTPSSSSPQEKSASRSEGKAGLQEYSPGILSFAAPSLVSPTQQQKQQQQQHGRGEFQVGFMRVNSVSNSSAFDNSVPALPVATSAVVAAPPKPFPNPPLPPPLVDVETMAGLQAGERDTADGDATVSMRTPRGSLRTRAHASSGANADPGDAVPQRQQSRLSEDGRSMRNATPMSGREEDSRQGSLPSPSQLRTESVLSHRHTRMLSGVLVLDSDSGGDGDDTSRDTTSSGATSRSVSRADGEHHHHHGGRGRRTFLVNATATAEEAARQPDAVQQSAESLEQLASFDLSLSSSLSFPSGKFAATAPAALEREVAAMSGLIEVAPLAGIAVSASLDPQADGDRQAEERAVPSRDVSHGSSPRSRSSSYGHRGSAAAIAKGSSFSSASFDRYSPRGGSALSAAQRLAARAARQLAAAAAPPLSMAEHSGSERWSPPRRARGEDGGAAAAVVDNPASNRYAFHGGGSVRSGSIDTYLLKDEARLRSLSNSDSAKPMSAETSSLLRLQRAAGPQLTVHSPLQSAAASARHRQSLSTQAASPSEKDKVKGGEEGAGAGGTRRRPSAAAAPAQPTSAAAAGREHPPGERSRSSSEVLSLPAELRALSPSQRGAPQRFPAAAPAAAAAMEEESERRGSQSVAASFAPDVETQGDEARRKLSLQLEGQKSSLQLLSFAPLMPSQSPDSEAMSRFASSQLRRGSVASTGGAAAAAHLTTPTSAKGNAAKAAGTAEGPSNRGSLSYTGGGANRNSVVSFEEPLVLSLDLTKGSKDEQQHHHHHGAGSRAQSAADPLSAVRNTLESSMSEAAAQTTTEVVRSQQEGTAGQQPPHQRLPFSNANNDGVSARPAAKRRSVVSPVDGSRLSVSPAHTMAYASSGAGKARQPNPGAAVATPFLLPNCTMLLSVDLGSPSASTLTTANASATPTHVASPPRTPRGDGGSAHNAVSVSGTLGTSNGGASAGAGESFLVSTNDEHRMFMMLSGFPARQTPTANPPLESCGSSVPTPPVTALSVDGGLGYGPVPGSHFGTARGLRGGLGWHGGDTAAALAASQPPRPPSAGRVPSASSTTTTTGGSLATTQSGSTTSSQRLLSHATNTNTTTTSSTATSASSHLATAPRWHAFPTLSSPPRTGALRLLMNNAANANVAPAGSSSGNAPHGYAAQAISGASGSGAEGGTEGLPARGPSPQLPRPPSKSRLALSPNSPPSGASSVAHRS